MAKSLQRARENALEGPNICWLKVKLSQNYDFIKEKPYLKLSRFSILEWCFQKRWIPELLQNLIQMFLNFALLLSFELSKGITVIFARTYIFFCNSYFYIEFLRENWTFFSRKHHFYYFHIFQYFLNYDRYFFNKFHAD